MLENSRLRLTSLQDQINWFHVYLSALPNVLIGLLKTPYQSACEPVYLEPLNVHPQILEGDW